MRNTWSGLSRNGCSALRPPLQHRRQRKLNGQSVAWVEVAGGARQLSTKVYWHCRRHVAFATGSTLNRLPSNLVWSAAGVPLMPTTSGLRRYRHLAVRSATSLRFLCAADITVRCIAASMKPRGGIGLVAIRARRPASFGLKHIRCQVQLVKSGQNYETKPIWKLAQYDFIQADRG